MNCAVMIWRLWVGTLIRLNLGCMVLLPMSYLNQKYSATFLKIHLEMEWMDL